MNILVSNDDGYQAPGLRILAARLREVATVTVVAPDRDRSGASNSLTLDRPLRAEAIEERLYRINGTPTDAVHLAVSGLLDTQPQMVISGINAGANLGDDVIYSGTVAAAMEGRFLGFPAFAVSLAGSELRHYDTAAAVVLQLLQQLPQAPLAANTLLNINVPDLPFDQLQGYEVTRLGSRHPSAPLISQRDPRGRPIHWIGPCGAEQDGGEGTDFYAIRQQRVSITPLQIDLTRHSAIPELNRWLNGRIT